MMENKNSVWYLDPLVIIPSIFIIQFFIWYFSMTKEPEISGVAPRFVTIESMAIYFLLLVTFCLGIILGKKVILRNMKIISNFRTLNQRKIRMLKGIAAVALILSILGELIYIRPIMNLETISLVLSTNFAALGETVRSAKITGISSLNNLFIIPTSIYALLAMNRKYKKSVRKKYFIYLMILGVAVLMHSLMLAARMFFVYYLCIVVCVILIEFRPRFQKFIKYISIGILLFIVMILMGEMLRYGMTYSNKEVVPLFSMTVLAGTVQYLLQAYIGSDLNNAFILISSVPSMQFVSTAPGISFFLSFLAPVQFQGYDSLPLWTSAYGTVNFIGLLWYDMGWIALLFSLGLGFYLGLLYKIVILRENAALSFSTLLYLISFPGFFSLSRVNYYGLSIYVISFLFILFTVIIYHLLEPYLKKTMETSEK